MAETVFACPACHQNISCDSAWEGQQIQCPLCHQTVTMPKQGGGASPARGNPLVPKPPAQSRLSLNQNAQQPASTHQKNIPIRNLSGPVQKKEGPWKMIAEIAGTVVVLGLVGWFGWPYVKAKLKPGDQQTASEPAAATAQRPAENQPAAPSPERPAEPGMAMPGPAPAAGMGGLGMTPPVTAPDGSTPVVVTNVAQTGAVIPPVHNLELAAARMPSGRVNGKITGGDFLPEIVRIDPVGTSQVLRFVQGELTSPDRELQVYLRLKPGEKLLGQKIEVTSEQRTRGLPQVIKRWKSNPKYAPNSRSYSSGYAMRIELTSHKDGVVKGKIYVALPDTEKSVVGGNFAAATSIPVEGVTAAPVLTAPGQMPGQNPAGAPGMPGMSPEFQKRYGGR